MLFSDEKELLEVIKNDILCLWNKEEVEKLIIYFFKYREVLVKELWEKMRKNF